MEPSAITGNLNKSGILSQSMLEGKKFLTADRLPPALKPFKDGFVQLVALLTPHNLNENIGCAFEDPDEGNWDVVGVKVRIPNAADTQPLIATLHTKENTGSETKFDIGSTDEGQTYIVIPTKYLKHLQDQPVVAMEEGHNAISENADQSKELNLDALKEEESIITPPSNSTTEEHAAIPNVQAIEVDQGTLSTITNESDNTNPETPITQDIATQPLTEDTPPPAIRAPSVPIQWCTQGNIPVEKISQFTREHKNGVQWVHSFAMKINGQCQPVYTIVLRVDRNSCKNERVLFAVEMILTIPGSTAEELSAGAAEYANEFVPALKAQLTTLQSPKNLYLLIRSHQTQNKNLYFVTLEPKQLCELGKLPRNGQEHEIYPELLFDPEKASQETSKSLAPSSTPPSSPIVSVAVTEHSPKPQPVDESKEVKHVKLTSEVKSNDSTVSTETSIQASNATTANVPTNELTQAHRASMPSIELALHSVFLNHNIKWDNHLDSASGTVSMEITLAAGTSWTSFDMQNLPTLKIVLSGPMFNNSSGIVKGHVKIQDAPLTVRLSFDEEKMRQLGEKQKPAVNKS